MSAIERFAQRLSQFQGVEHFVLARNDGQLVTHNLSEPDDLASLVTLCGLNAQAIRKTIGFSRFRHLVCTNARQANLIIFPLDRYFLGIFKRTGANQAELIDEVSRFLQRLTVPQPAGS
jgi:predicted regulator of Ras-like GTPase activity (Roadblock/LC7/MglB family)